MVAQLNGALDLTLDGEVFAAVQFTLDNHRFADVHDIPLQFLARFRPVGGCGGWRRLLRRLRRRLSACWRADRFIPFPHV
jgi:hypothetical protein